MGAENGKPCAECPFRRDSPADLCDRFRAAPESFVGQAHGPFVLPCHKGEGFQADACDPSLRQCAGARAFRANVGAAVSPCLVGSPDPVTYFATEAEFIAHHRRVPIGVAEAFLEVFPPESLLRDELERPGWSWSARSTAWTCPGCRPERNSQLRSDLVRHAADD